MCTNDCLEQQAAHTPVFHLRRIVTVVFALALMTCVSLAVGAQQTYGNPFGFYDMLGNELAREGLPEPRGTDAEAYEYGLLPWNFTGGLTLGNGDVIIGQPCNANISLMPGGYISDPIIIFGPIGKDNIKLLTNFNPPLQDVATLSPITQGDSVRQWYIDMLYLTPDIKLEVAALLAHVTRTKRATSAAVILTASVFSEMLTDMFDKAFPNATSFIELPLDPNDGLTIEDRVKDVSAIFLLGPSSTEMESITAELFSSNAVQGKMVASIFDVLPMLGRSVDVDATQMDLADLVVTSPFPIAGDARFAFLDEAMENITHETPSMKAYERQTALAGWMVGRLFDDVLSYANPPNATRMSNALSQSYRFTYETLAVGDFFNNCSPGIASYTCMCNQGGRVAFVGHGARDASGGLSLRAVPEGDATTPMDLCDLSLWKGDFFLPVPILVFNDSTVVGNGPWNRIVHLPDPGSEVYRGLAQYAASLSSDRFLTSHPVAPGFFGTATSTNGGLALQDVFSREVQDLYTPVVTGYLSWAIGNLNGPLVVDPLRLPIAPASLSGNNEIHLFTTLEQELYAIFSYLAEEDRAAPVAVGVADSNVAGGISLYETIGEMVAKMARRFGVTLKGNAVKRLQVLDKLSLPSQGRVVLVGAATSSLSASILAAHLELNPGVTLYLPFDEVSLLFPLFKNDPIFTFTRSAMRRLCFATNCPVRAATGSFATWTTPSSSTDIGNPLPDDIPLAVNTPLAMRAYMVAAFAAQVSATTGQTRPSAHDLQEALYDQEVFPVAGVPFGPFTQECEVGAQQTSCRHAYAPSPVGVHSFAEYIVTGEPPVRAAAPLAITYDVVNGPDPDTPSTTTPSTTTSTKAPPTPVPPTATTQLPGGDPSSEPPRAPAQGKQTTVGIAVGVVVGVLLLALLAFLLVYFCCLRGDSRDDRNAPIDPDKPVTLIFTDIESSTALWATVPAVMSKAVQTHHRVMRELIVKHRCYEVKTIGDSFMIACASADAAIALCHEAQLRLQATNWGSGAEIDAAYRQFALAKLRKEARKAQRRGGGGGTGEEAVADEALGGDWALPEEAYARVWCGLRVRIGMHTGLCDIARDPVTQRFDYYGTTVNMAARTESLGAGGQVLCTCATHDALSAESLAQYRFTPRGAHVLRGVSEPVEMLELATVDGRRFDTPVPSATSQDAEAIEREARKTIDADEIKTGDDTFGVSANASSTSPLMLHSSPPLPTFGNHDNRQSSHPHGTQVLEESGDDVLDLSTVSSEAQPHTSPATAAEILDVYFSAYPARTKGKMLAKTCKHLGVEAPQRKHFATTELWADALVAIIAQRTSAVIEYRHNLDDEEKEYLRLAQGAGSPDGAAESSEAHPLQVHVDAATPLEPPGSPPGEKGSRRRRSSAYLPSTLSLQSDTTSTARTIGHRVLLTNSVYVDNVSSAVGSSRAATDRRRSRVTLRELPSPCKSTTTLPSTMRADPSAASVRSAATNSAFLVLDNGEVVELRTGEHDGEDGGQGDEEDRSSDTSSTSHDSSPADKAKAPTTAPHSTDTGDSVVPFAQTPAASPNAHFTNVGPSVPFEDIVPCFSVSNGLLFRVVNHTQRFWAYYNDTTEYVMVVHFSLGRYSRVRPGDERVVLSRNEETRRYEGELIVQPLETRVMARGTINGFKVKYSAYLLNEFDQV